MEKLKVLLFNGSPKKEKSDTLHITKAFLDGIREVKDVEIKVINTIDCNIKYCLGCFSCKKNGGSCVIDDDMKNILNDILNSDVLLFSFPLYCYGLPASLKALLDRTMPLSSMKMVEKNGKYEHISQANFSHLKYVMISGCGFPNSKNNFEALVKEFELMFPNNHTIITVPESPMFNEKVAESVTIPFLDKVKKAGREYGINFEISNETLEKLKIPMIPEEVYAKICNGEN